MEHVKFKKSQIKKILTSSNIDISHIKIKNDEIQINLEGEEIEDKWNEIRQIIPDFFSGFYKSTNIFITKIVSFI